MHQHFGPRVDLGDGFSGAVTDGMGRRQGQLARQLKVQLHKPDIARDPCPQVVGTQHAWHGTGQFEHVLADIGG